MSFQLPELPYAFDALEAAIDAQTVEIHYTKHHAAYLKNLNTAFEKYPLFLTCRLKRSWPISPRSRRISVP